MDLICEEPWRDMVDEGAWLDLAPRQRSGTAGKFDYGVALAERG